VSTDVLERPDVQLSETADALDHYFCCDPDVSCCGLDISNVRQVSP
jgi:hypothetical protein